MIETHEVIDGTKNWWKIIYPYIKWLSTFSYTEGPKHSTTAWVNNEEAFWGALTMYCSNQKIWYFQWHLGKTRWHPNNRVCDRSERQLQWTRSNITPYCIFFEEPANCFYKSYWRIPPGLPKRWEDENPNRMDYSDSTLVPRIQVRYTYVGRLAKFKKPQNTP